MISRWRPPYQTWRPSTHNFVCLFWGLLGQASPALLLSQTINLLVVILTT